MRRFLSCILSFIALCNYLTLSALVSRSCGHSIHEEIYGRRYDHYHGKYSDSELMVDVINNLGLNILVVHNEFNENNIAFSPYGAAVILIALGEGLQGEALYEIRKAIHLPYDSHTIRVGLRDIHRHLKSYFIPKEGFLAGITLNNDNVTINQKYIDLLRFYGYDVNSFVNLFKPDDGGPSTEMSTTTVVVGQEETTLEIQTTPRNEMDEIPTEIIPTTFQSPKIDSTTVSSTEISKNDDQTETSMLFTSETTTSVNILNRNPPTTDEDEMEQETTTISSTTVESIPSDLSGNNTIVVVNNNTLIINFSQNGTRNTTSDDSDTIGDEETIFSSGNMSAVNVNVNNNSSETSRSTQNDTGSINVITKNMTEDEENSNSSEVRTKRSLRKNDIMINAMNLTADDDSEEYDEGIDVENNESPEIIEINDHAEELKEVFNMDREETSDLRKKRSIDHHRLSNQDRSNVNVEINRTNVSFDNDNSDEMRNPQISGSEHFQVNDRVENVGIEGDDEKEQLVRRTSRSVDDYGVFHNYDHPQFRPPRPYLPDEPPYFLVNGKFKESNLDFMTYDTVLPFLLIPHLKATALAFPLDSDKYYLLLVLPYKFDGLDELICNIRGHNFFKYIIHNMELTHVKATIPSFSLRGRITLTNTLQKMGIRKIFEPRQADFTPMTNDENIYVTNVEQAVSVTIKNYVDLTRGGRYGNHYFQESVRFDVNHPFLYFVIDSDLDVVLMAGKVVNPLNLRVK